MASFARPFHGPGVLSFRWFVVQAHGAFSSEGSSHFLLAAVAFQVGQEQPHARDRAEASREQPESHQTHTATPLSTRFKHFCLEPKLRI